MTILKYFIFFIISFLILSIPISDDPMFTHLHKNLRPYTNLIFAKSKEKVREGKEIGTKYLLNSIPKQ